MGEAWAMLELDHYQNALDLGSDLSEVFECANSAFGSGLWASGRRLCSPRGYELNYLPSDPRSSNATRYLRRDEGANARGQMLSSRFGSGDQGAYEAEYTRLALTASRTYLAEGVLHNGAGDQQGLSFMHQDRLGSALVISDKGGGILGSDNGQAEFRTFDAFGKARDNQGLDMLNGRLFANNPNGKRNRKGFTGHEHLDEAGLIHMNGRAYDYNLGRFYGVDPVIQFPTNSQSLNGYSYLMNNPLSGTDPTGYCAAATGTHIKDCNYEVTTSYSDGSSKTTTGLGAREAANKFVSDIGAIAAGMMANGASSKQDVSQKSLTDGAKGGASGVGSRPLEASLPFKSVGNEITHKNTQEKFNTISGSKSRSRLENLNGKINLYNSNEELKSALTIILSNEIGLTTIEKAIDRWGILSIKGLNGVGFNSIANKDGSVVIDLNQSMVAFEFEFRGGSKEANAIIEGRMPGFYPSPGGRHPFYTKFYLVRALAHEISHSAHSNFSSIVSDEPDTIRHENEIMKSIYPNGVERVLCHECWQRVKDLEN